tara:strand:- start:1332 stop:2087 length:756 start_codon:yes stop_codon:yes gene_type:complete
MLLEKQYISNPMLKEKIITESLFHDVEKIPTIEKIIHEIKNQDNKYINVYWLGKRKYNPIWELQMELHKLRVEKKINDTVLLLEHDHVYTLGKNANENHILPSKLDDTEVIKIDRGGDVTYHGPGQLVGYPIIDLHNYKMSISWYLNVLSDSIVELLNDYKILSKYNKDYVGVWVDDDKIAAFGVRLSKWITMHGFALNVSTDLKYYNGLIPCGIFEKGVTSIKNISKCNYTCANVAKEFTKYFIKNLNKE